MWTGALEGCPFGLHAYGGEEITSCSHSKAIGGLVSLPPPQLCFWGAHHSSTYCGTTQACGTSDKVPTGCQPMMDPVKLATCSRMPLS